MKIHLRWLCLLLFINTNITGQPLPDLIPYRDGNLWGYADSSGKIRIQPQWYDARPFAGNNAWVYPGQTAYGQPDNGHISIIDTKGQYLLPPSRHWTGHSRLELNSSNEQGLLGITDSLNRVKLPFLYQQVTSGNQFYANKFLMNPEYNTWFMIAQKNGRQGVIDTLNRELIPFVYDRVLLPHSYSGDDSLCAFIIVREGRYGLISWQNKILVPPVYDSVYFDRHFLHRFGFVFIMNKGKTGVADTGNRVLVPARYKLVYPASPYYQYQKEYGFTYSDSSGQLFGWINASGKEVTPPIYAAPHRPGTNHTGLIIAEQPIANGTRSGLIAADGTVLLPARYEKISVKGDSVATFVTLREKEDTAVSRETAFLYIAGKLKQLDSQEKRTDISWRRNLRNSLTPICGTSSYGYSEPRYFRGRHQDEFTAKDGTTWRITGYIRQSDTSGEYREWDRRYFCVASSAEKDSLGRLYNNVLGPRYSFINEREEFLVPPQPDYQVTGGILSRNRLYIVNKKSETALADTLLRPLSPFLPYPELQSCLQDGTEYLYVRTDRQRQILYLSSESSLFVTDTAKIVRKEPKDAYSPGIYGRAVWKLTDHQGKIVPGFEPCDALYRTDSSGIEPYRVSSNRAPLWLVRDTATGRVGFKDFSGQTIYPQLSFRYMVLIPLKQSRRYARLTDEKIFDTIPEPVFLARDQADKWGYVRANGTVLFPEISFRYYNPVSVLSAQLFYVGDDSDERFYRAGKRLNGVTLLLNHHNERLLPVADRIYDIQEAGAWREDSGLQYRAKGLFRMSYQYKGKNGQVYADKYGRIYGEHLFEVP